MTNVINISSHDELIASIPHTLGFTPQGMVCRAFGGGPTARLDIPESPAEMDEFLRVLSDVYLHQHHPERVALVAYGEDGPGCLQALAALGEALVRSDGRAPEVGPILWVNGEHWTDVLEGTRGTVDPGARTRMDAEFALLGRVMPVDRREDLDAAMQGDPTAVAQLLPAATARILEMDAASRRSEAEWLGERLDQFGRDREYLVDHDAARVLAVMHDTGARDAAETRMSREHAPILSEFWGDTVRRAPSEVRDAAAAMLAFSSYPDGKGARAWVAIDQLTASHPLADLVTIALERAIDPREMERAIRPAPSGALMQHAALHDTHAHERRPDHDAQNSPGLDGAGPDSSAFGR
ncbi:DUF4192 domain-containing protein [Nocardioides sp. B-3]|uniref:DUF4192 domain-containing protein n=1 Tax=Nocardioides sp. B-3 TaxID=2895565 RepID=UPI002152ACFB|nr:DUF4192 domain-containing protein [Nocardioides sp. B-3]UUZ59598.1 DUF4192 domain-containing protein [Nocardioides sp. B-3]